MAEVQRKVGNPNQVFFYYPAWNKKFVRRVLAGIVNDNTLYVAQAALFPGFKPQLVPVTFRNGQTVFIVDPGMPADAFDKKEGRRIATERCTGIKVDGDKKYPVGRTILFKIDLPAEDVNPGKIFVGACENYLKAKGFPEKPAKPKKKDTPEPGPPGESNK